MQKGKHLFLKNGIKIILNDDSDIDISVWSNDEIRDTIQVPYPCNGYGGGELLISSSEKYLIFSYYSGENEEGFILFALTESGLKLIYESGYIYGESASYCFSNDEKYLFQAVRTGRWYQDEAETDDRGEKFYQFGTVNILNINEKIFRTHIINVYPTDLWEEEITDNGNFELLNIENEDTICITFPWGTEKTDGSFLEDMIIKF